MTEHDQRRGIWVPEQQADGTFAEVWRPTTRQQRRAGWRELIGHSTRNGALVSAKNGNRAERRRRARELWRAGQRSQGR